VDPKSLDTFSKKVVKEMREDDPKISKFFNEDNGEQTKIVEHAKSSGHKLSKDFCDMFLTEVSVDDYLIDEDKKISADFTYHIERLIEDKGVIFQLEELDRIMFDHMAA